MSEESELQKFAVPYLRVALRPLGGTVFVVPNNRDSRKVAGFRPGAPDLAVVLRGEYIGIELKAAKGVLSNDQLDMHAELKAAGAKILIARNLAELNGIVSALSCGRIAA